MPRVIAPAGMPISIGEVLRIFLGYIFGPSRERRRKHIRQALDVRYLFAVNSGRTALTLALQALSDMDGERKQVVLPAYTCYSVAASIVRAGLSIRTIDIDPHTLDYDYAQLEALDFSEVLAIVGSSLFGVLNDWDRLRRIAANKRIVLIDDAAQSFGAEYKGTPCGRLGDIGFYSLGRGKNVTAYSGGLLLTDNNDIADAVAERVALLPNEGFGSDISVYVKLKLYAILLRPWLYWIPARMPFLGLGETVYEEAFEMARLGRMQLTAFGVLHPRLHDIQAGRIETAQKIAEAIKDIPGISIPGFDADYTPAYIRLPLLMRAKKTRDAAIAALTGEGIMASTMYPGIIPDIPEVKEHLVASDDSFGGARIIADRLLTLPTHAYVSDRDIDRMAACLRAVAEEAR